MTSFRDLSTVAGPTREREPFSFVAVCRVAFSDTDAQGIVYYGRYAPYFDVARVEYFRHLDLEPHYRDDRDGELVMRHFAIDYSAPATFDDLLEVFCRVSKIGNSSITVEYSVVLVKNQVELATATQVMVNVDLATRRPRTVPDAIRTKILAFEKSL